MFYAFLSLKIVSRKLIVEILIQLTSHFIPGSLPSVHRIFSSRIIQNFEIGKTFGPLDIGIAFGRFSNADSTNFAELRTTFDAMQLGVFSSEFGLGVGKVFNSNTPLMFEISTTLLAQFTKKIGVGAIFGNYDLIGESTQNYKTFYSLFLRYGLMRSESGGLVGRASSRLGKRTAKRRKARF